MASILAALVQRALQGREAAEATLQRLLIRALAVAAVQMLSEETRPLTAVPVVPV